MSGKTNFTKLNFLANWFFQKQQWNRLYWKLNLSIEWQICDSQGLHYSKHWFVANWICWDHWWNQNFTKPKFLCDQLFWVNNFLSKWQNQIFWKSNFGGPPVQPIFHQTKISWSLIFSGDWFFLVIDFSGDSSETEFDLKAMYDYVFCLYKVFPVLQQSSFCFDF